MEEHGDDWSVVERKAQEPVAVVREREEPIVQMTSSYIVGGEVVDEESQP